jgi:3-oxoacyl-[acyl-carrier-protein] synthase II
MFTFLLVNLFAGVGLVSPLGCGSERVWQRLVKGESGIRSNPIYDDDNNNSVKCVASVPRKSECDDRFDHEELYDEEVVFGRSVSREYSSFIQFGVYASDLALQHAGISASVLSEMDCSRFGVAIAGGIGSLDDIISTSRLPSRRVSPYFIPKILVNMTAGQVSIRHKLRGPNHTVSTACAAGSHAIGDAFNFIRWNYADRMLAGGSEASICELSLNAFAKMRALSVKEGITSSSPFDVDRDGFVMGEGAGILVLEELEAALKRNAPIVAEIIGYGLTGDAYHSTTPSPAESGGAFRGMKSALLDAGITIDDVGYINAHATSTPVGDAIESMVIDRLLLEQKSVEGDRRGGSPLYVSSMKGAIGHLLGASGAVETAFTAFALRDSLIPSTLNLSLADPTPAVGGFQHVKGAQAVSCPELRYAMKNSFGFGGTNAVLVLKKH